MSEPVLEAVDLSCGYRATGRIVQGGIDLALRRGRFLCIVGPNGAGKTTLIKTLAGLLPALCGSVHLGGRTLQELSPLERARRLSVVLTSMISPGYLTVRRFVELGRHPHTGLLARLTAPDREAVAAALRRTGVLDLADRWMSEISDGERQRVAIARALAQAADVMILDEPTAFLDVAARATIMTSLRALAHRLDRLIIASSHDIELVLRTADLIAVVRDDSPLVVGSPEDLVLAGVMGTLFHDRTLRFDTATGTFRLPEPSGPPVRLVGSGQTAEWTAHALERIGLTVIRGAGAPGQARPEAGATPRVSVPDRPESPWHLYLPGSAHPVTAANLSDLTDLLRFRAAPEEPDR